jgi:hypothetical protein
LTPRDKLCAPGILAVPLAKERMTGSSYFPQIGILPLPRCLDQQK